jgi:hypothetical protein
MAGKLAPGHGPVDHDPRPVEQRAATTSGCGDAVNGRPAKDNRSVQIMYSSQNKIDVGTSISK